MKKGCLRQAKRVIITESQFSELGQLNELHGKVADAYAQRAADWFGVELGSRIASGLMGTAYHVKGKPLVIKVTDNEEERLFSQKLWGVDSKYLAPVHDMYLKEFDKAAKLMGFYPVIGADQKYQYRMLVRALTNFYYSVQGGGLKHAKYHPFVLFKELDVEAALKWLPAKFESQRSWIYDLKNMVLEAKKYGIVYLDMSEDNFAIKDGHLILFDI